MHRYMPCAASWWLSAPKPLLNGGRPLLVLKPPLASALMGHVSVNLAVTLAGDAGHFVCHHF